MPVKITGIKCDNPNCDYKDMSEIKDYKSYINKPCPKCGCSLLTKADYRSMMALKMLDKIFNPLQHGEVEMTVDMDGSGKMDFKMKEDNKDEHI